MEKFSLGYCLLTVEPPYFDFSGEGKNSLKKQEYETDNSQWLKDKSKGNGVEFEILRDLQ